MRKIQPSGLGLIVGLLTCLHATGQEPMFSVQPEAAPKTEADFIYDEDLPDADFHHNRREALRAIMPDSSVAVFFANPVRNRSNDVNYEYHQDPNFYYLTGLREPHAMVMIFKEEKQFDGFKTNELIFVQPRDPSSEIWNGRRLGVRGVSQVLGLGKVLENKDFSRLSIDWEGIRSIYYETPKDDIRDDDEDRGDLYSLVKHFRNKVAKTENDIDPRRVRELMATLREIKQEEELVLLRKAVDATCEALSELMKAL